jgi:5'-3' exonuclease
MRLELFDANNVLRRQLESFGTISRERMIVDSCQPNHFYVWDGYNHNARRREFFPGYKIRPETGADIFAWLDMMRELIMYTSATQIEVPEWEADDVIGVLARRWIAQGHEVHIHSNDLDYFQIEGAVLAGVKNPTGVERKYIPLYKTLVGDTSDKIPGIPGFGEAAFMKLEPYWDDLLADFENTHWSTLPISKKCLAWVYENLPLLHAYWKIVHLWDMPLDLIDEHTYPGLDNRDGAEAILRKFML